MRFLNKIVLISGGASGIGLATSRAFLEEGAQVIIISRSSRKVKDALSKQRKYKNRLTGYVCDASDERNVTELISKIAAQFKRIDILINSAGLSKPAKTEDLALAEWYDIIDNNLTNCFLLSKHVLKLMRKRKRGVVVNVSSIAGRFRSKLAGVHYTCAKAGVIALTRQLAAEFGPIGIRINVVCPSQTETEMLKPFLTPETKKRLIEAIPLRRLATVKDQANAILFLASNEASYITGGVLDVNGGQL